MSKEAMKLALEALENLLNEASSHNNNSYCQLDVIDTEEADNAIKALEEALAKQEQGEPVAFITPLMESQMFDDWCPYKGNPDPRVVWAAAIEAVNGLLLEATPQQRTWVGLTDEDIEEIWGEDLRVMYSGNIEATKAIEAKLKEKNT